MKIKTLILCLLVINCSSTTLSPILSGDSNITKYTAQPAVSQRLQWHENFGYCGETSYVTIGLSLGQYVSQFTMRSIASPGLAQNNINSQLLLGTANAKSSANTMHFVSSTNYDSSTKDFLKWIKEQLSLGHPVVLGVYLNEQQFYGHTIGAACTQSSTCTNSQTCIDGYCQSGDPEYDHIVTAVSVQTSHPCSAPGTCSYYDDDIITIDDHGLFASECDYGNTFLGCPPKGNPANLCSPNNYTYLYSYSFGDFQKTRAQANDTKDVYSIAESLSTNSLEVYGISIQGVQGQDELLPVQLNVDKNYECTTVGHDSNSAPTPNDPLALTINVPGMIAGKIYKLYRYTNFSDVPTSDFDKNSQACLSNKTCSVSQISTDSPPPSDSITTNQTVIYRAVKPIKQRSNPVLIR